MRGNDDLAAFKVMAQAALGIEIAIEVDFFDPAFSAGFFQRFTRGCFTQ